MREFTRTLEAGQQDRVAAGGDYVYFKSGEGEIKLITDSGNDVILRVGQGVRFDKKFNTIDTQNINSEKSTFVIMIGLGFFQNSGMDGIVNVRQTEVVDVRQTEIIEVKQTGVADVKPAGGSIAVGAKKIGSLLPVRTFEEIPARENREKLLINYFNHKPMSNMTSGLVSLSLIIVKVDGVPLSFYASYGKAGSIEINTTKALEVQVLSKIWQGEIVMDHNVREQDYIPGSNSYTGGDMYLSIVEVLNDEAEP